MQLLHGFLQKIGAALKRQNPSSPETRQTGFRTLLVYSELVPLLGARAPKFAILPGDLRRFHGLFEDRMKEAEETKALLGELRALLYGGRDELDPALGFTDSAPEWQPGACPFDFIVACGCKYDIFANSLRQQILNSAAKLDWPSLPGTADLPAVRRPPSPPRDYGMLSSPRR